MRRVLQPGGRFACVTNCERQVREEARRAAPEWQVRAALPVAAPALLAAAAGAGDPLRPAVVALVFATPGGEDEAERAEPAGIDGLGQMDGVD